MNSNNEKVAKTYISWGNHSKISRTKIHTQKKMVNSWQMRVEKIVKRMLFADFFAYCHFQCVRDVEYSSNVNDVTVVEFHSLVAEMLQKRRAFCVYAAKNKTFGKRMKQFYETQLERVQLSFWKMMNATKTSTITANTTEPNFTSITTKDW